MLGDREHVEAVALLRELLDAPGTVMRGDLRDGIEGWLKENHPPPEAYIATMKSLAAERPDRV